MQYGNVFFITIINRMELDNEGTFGVVTTKRIDYHGGRAANTVRKRSLMRDKLQPTQSTASYHNRVLNETSKSPGLSLQSCVMDTYKRSVS